VTIGSGSRIGANAVVVRDVPPDSVVVGVPGQVIAAAAPARRPPHWTSPTACCPIWWASPSGPAAPGRRLEQVVGGRVRVPEIRPDESGVWRGEDFSI